MWGALREAQREKQIIAERLSSFLSGNDGAAGGGNTQKMNTERYLKPLLKKKKKRKENGQSKLVIFSPR